MICKFHGCRNPATYTVIVHRARGKSPKTKMCQEHLEGLQVYAALCDLPVSFETIETVDVRLWLRNFPDINPPDWTDPDDVAQVANQIATDYDMFRWKKFGLFARHYGYLQDRPTPAQFLEGQAT